MVLTAGDVTYLAALAVQFAATLVWLVVVGVWLVRRMRRPLTPMPPTWITVGLPLLCCLAIGVRFALGERWWLVILQAPVWMATTAGVVYLRRLHLAGRHL